MSLKDYEAKIKKIAAAWPQTVNVTTLDAMKEILRAVDTWRRKGSDENVVEALLQCVFYLLATCAKLNHKADLNTVFKRICKKAGALEGPADIVWSFLIFEGPPSECSKDSQLHLNEPTAR